jgi:hypothetical protein
MEFNGIRHMNQSGLSFTPLDEIIKKKEIRIREMMPVHGFKIAASMGIRHYSAPRFHIFATVKQYSGP